MNRRAKNAERETKQLVGAGASFFAGTLLLTAGLLVGLLGFSAIVENDLLTLSPRWVFRLNANTWGWIHILLGIFMVAGGIAAVFRSRWSRAAAISLAVASIVVFFVWVPYYPVWSIVVIALNVLVI